MSISYNPRPMGESVAASSEKKYSVGSNLPYIVEPPFNEEVVETSKKVSIRDNVEKFVNPKTIVMSLIVFFFVAMSFKSSDQSGGFFAVLTMVGFTYCLSAINLKGRYLLLILGFFCWIMASTASLGTSIPWLPTFYGLVTLVVGFGQRYGFIGDSSYSKKFLFAPASYHDTIVSVWGTAGGHIGDAREKFGEKADIGARGEKMVGNVLDKVAAEYPHVRVFHGMRFTMGEDGADVDHIVLIGKMVFLIDAKNWKKAFYSWTLDGIVYRDGMPFPGGDVHMNNAWKNWNAYLSGTATNIQSFICFAQPDPKNEYGYSNKNAGVSKLITLNELDDYLREVASRTQPMVDRRLVNALMSQRQK